MKKLSSCVLGAILATVVGTSALANEKCFDFAVEQATTPVPPYVISGMKITKTLIEKMPSNPDLVFIGDSLLMLLDKELKAGLPNKEVFNFSVGSDRTQHALWRLEQIPTQLSHSPKGIVILLGTNNLSDGGMDACGTFAGLEAVIKKTREIWAKAPIFLVTVPPRGADFLQFDKERLLLNERISKVAGNNVFPVLLSDREMTCNQYGRAPLPSNTLACFKENAYTCGNYKDDNLHLLPPALKVINAKISAASLASIGTDILK
ncbi:GDSL-like Lipase/Acylhydrolase family protein [Rhizobium sp. RU20A]|uniref:GDSL-type esterase/lipase family protein n=1 Tax=Rhizobium sp. RU20A TaxID=1907412 RepID=UPI0009559060|nr:GDSL-type esterase/lipase family protein [Rhizobium sp. RU20A]SIR11263.1 GDSL-like Lipase/Acylhydrolase family protein [Rhizobium sp. RU20A]